MSAHELRMAELLEQYLEELETNPDAAPPRELDPQMLQTVQKMETHFASDPSPEFIASLRGQIERAAMQESARAKQNESRRGIFSLPRWSFVGVAAALVLAVVAFALWSTRPASVSAAQVLARAGSVAANIAATGVKSFELESVSDQRIIGDAQLPDAGMSHAETKMQYTGPTRWRVEGITSLPGGDTIKTLIVSDGATLWTYDAYNNLVLADVATGEGLPLPNVGSLQLLKQDWSNCYDPQIVGEETIAGRAAYRVALGENKCHSASIVMPAFTRTLWIDKETFFVLKDLSTTLDGKQTLDSYQVNDIQYNLELPKDTFRFIVPPGASIKDNRPQPAPSAQEYQAQLSALAQKVEFPVFVPTHLPNGLVPRAPQRDEIESQITLAYVPADEVTTNTQAMQNGVSILEQRADYETVRNWTDGAQPFALDNAQGWLRRGDYDPNVGTGSNSAAYVLRDGTLLSISSFTIAPEQLVAIAKSLEPVPGSHAPLPNPTAPTLNELRAQADYPIFIPAYVPKDLTPAQPQQNQIEYYRADGIRALIVQNAKQGNGGMEQEPRFQGETVKLSNGREVHQLLFEPEIVILWWNQDGGYTSLEGHGIARDEMLKIAASMSSTAELGETQAPPAQPTPTPIAAPSFNILRPTWLPEEMTIYERNVPTPNGQGAGIEIRFDPHPDGTPHDMLTLTEMPKEFADVYDDPQFQKKEIGGRDVTFNKIGEGCVLYSWVQNDVALTLTNAYDPPGQPGQVRYTCEQMEKIIASIQ